MEQIKKPQLDSQEGECKHSYLLPRGYYLGELRFYCQNGCGNYVVYEEDELPSPPTEFEKW